MSDILNLSVKEIAILAGLPSYQSLRAHARALRLSPAQLSKVIRQLEHHFQLQIIYRSTSGVSLTDDGRRLCSIAGEVLDAIKQLQNVTDGKPTQQYAQTLNMGSRGFLNAELQPAIVEVAELESPAIRIQAVDLSPDETMTAARNGSLDLAITMDSLDLGRMWTEVKLGDLAWGLFCRQDHPLASAKRQDDLHGASFVWQVYWDGTTIVSGQDILPLPANRRIMAHMTQSASTAANICSGSDHLTFIPTILGKKHPGITEIFIEDMQQVRFPLYFAVNIDRVSERLFNALQDRLKQALIPSRGGHS